MQTGTLFYVVGPSGVGKDTLMAHAMAMLAPTGRYVQARRAITRPKGPGEDHEPVDDAEFERRRLAGGFLHHWGAHGLKYGLPISILDDLKAGRNVLANGSRGALPDLTGVVDRFVVVEITAPNSVLKARLLARGRESEADVDARLARKVAPLPVHLDDVTVVNDADVEEGAARLVAALEAQAARLAVRRMPISSAHGYVAYLPADCRLVDTRAYAEMSRIDVIGKTASIRATVHVAEAGLAPHEIGLSREAHAALALPDGALVAIQRTPSPTSRRLLQRKIAGEALSADEYAVLFRDVVEGRYPESETAAFLVKMVQTLDEGEVVAVARARTQFMPRIAWPNPIVVDKHSLGGIPGSRITLIVVPIVAAHGLLMPKTSSRAITSASGTADVMEAIARIDLDAQGVRRVVEEVGGCIAWNGRLNHSVLDDIVNSIARPLDINNNYWSVASILSKKWSAGSTHVVVDMPYGPRTKLKTLEEAHTLGRVFELVGRGLGLEVRAKATDGSGPVGRGIGPALELRDVLKVLDNAPDAPSDLREKALLFAAEILSFDPKLGSVQAARARAEELLASGSAKARFMRIVAAQGPVSMVGPGPLQHTVRAPAASVVTDVDGWHLAGIARRAGAPHDKGAGIDLMVRQGDAVAAHGPLYVIHAASPTEFEAAVAMAHADPGIALGQSKALLPA